MFLTQFTNYAFRTLIYVALNENRPVSVKNIALTYGISYNHLKKVTSALIDQKLLITIRGRGGGLMLAKPPEDILVGTVIRRTEPSFALFECFDPETGSSCPLIPACGLKSLLGEALAAFFAVIDKATLADLIQDPRLTALLALPSDKAPAPPPTRNKSNRTQKSANKNKA